MQGWGVKMINGFLSLGNLINICETK